MGYAVNIIEIKSLRGLPVVAFIIKVDRKGQILKHVLKLRALSCFLWYFGEQQG